VVKGEMKEVLAASCNAVLWLKNKVSEGQTDGNPAGLSGRWARKEIIFERRKQDVCDWVAVVVFDNQRPNNQPQHCTLSLFRRRLNVAKRLAA
jgi:hypothetical protein